MADIWMLLLFAFLLPTYFSSCKSSKQLATRVVVLVTPIVFLILDFINEIPLSDTIRGLARNGVFIAGIVALEHGSEKTSLKITLTAFACICVGYGLHGMIEKNPFEDLQSYIKYYGGNVLAIGILILLGNLNFPRIVQLVSLVYGAYLAFFVFIRGMGFYFVSLSGIFYFRTYLGKIPKWAIVVLAVFTPYLALAVILPYYQTNYTLFYDNFENMQYSNTQRLDMILVSFDEWKMRPVLGYGSWQNARNYVDILNREDLVGVHSVGVQLMYEYGLIGIIAALSIFFVGLQSFITAVRLKLSKGEDFFVVNALIISSLFVLYAFLMNPFAGFNRILLGSAIGIDLFFLRQVKALQVRDSKERIKLHRKTELAHLNSSFSN